MTTGVEQALPELAKQNGATIGRLLANGNLGHAEEKSGRMRAQCGEAQPQQHDPSHLRSRRHFDGAQHAGEGGGAG